MKVSKVQWFHPDGEKMPNGVFFQRGGWLAECAENARRFAATDGVGVVVFPSGAQVEDSGRAFTGSYVSEGGIRYDSESPTRVLEGVSGRNLLKRAAELAVQWGQPEVLVREADGKEIWVVSVSDREAAMAQVADNRADEGETAEIRECVAMESRRCEEWVRCAGRVVVARVQVEERGAPEGVFRSARLKAENERRASGMEFALRWERKGEEQERAVVERALVVFRLRLEEVEELVASVPGAVCREVQVGSEVKGDGSWLEETFGERPAGVDDGEWVLEEAGYIEPPRPSVFGRHDRYLPIRERGDAWAREAKEEAATRQEPVAPAVEMKSAIRAVTLLQWMGPRAWANQAEEQRMPERIEKMLRDGHHAWFRVATGEGVPTSRCWMVFNEPGAWEYWQKYGVMRVLDVSEEGCRGYWSGDGRQWWKVEACAPRGKRVHVWNAKVAYRAACGEMPWEVPFFDRSDRNRERLEKMYAYMVGVLGREGLDEARVKRRLDTATTAQSGFSRWANRGMLYGGQFKWEKGEMW